MYRTQGVNDANNGSQVIGRVPYKSTDLPLEKIHRICNRAIQNVNTRIQELDISLFENLKSLCDESLRFVRMTDLISEARSLQIKGENENEDQIIEIENEREGEESGTDSEVGEEPDMNNL